MENGLILANGEFVNQQQVTNQTKKNREEKRREEKTDQRINLNKEDQWIDQQLDQEI